MESILQSEYAQQRLEQALPDAVQKLASIDADVTQGALQALHVNAQVRRPEASEWDSSLRDAVSFQSFTYELDQAAQKLCEELKKRPWDSDLGMKLFFNRLMARSAALTAIQGEATIGSFAKLADQYPTGSRRAGANHKAVEQLIYTAFNAANENYKATVVKPFATGEKLSLEAATEKLASTDPAYAIYRSEEFLAEFFHNALADSTDLYEVAAAAQSHGAALASCITQTMRYELKNPSGQNTYLLHSLLDSARHEALTAISRCQEHKIRCWRPVSLVSIADARRDAPSEDKLEVLRRYYEAAIQAKLLNLLFSN